MKFYWKMIAGISALMLLLLVMPYSPWWCAAGIVSCVLSGYAGVKLAPHVPTLRNQYVWLAVSIIVLGTLLQGIGLFSHLFPIWGLGLTMTLALPLAGLAHDIRVDAIALRELLAS